MILLVDNLKIAIVVFGLAHFIMAYLYGYEAAKEKSIFLSGLGFIFLLSAILFSSEIATKVFLLVSSIIFTIHHSDDTYRIFSSRAITIFWILYGALAVTLIYSAYFLKIIPETIPIILFFIMTIYHYVMWYIFYWKKFHVEKRKLYLYRILGIHVGLFSFFSLSSLMPIIAVLFSFRFFHLQTINHIVFSYYRFWNKRK